MKTYTKEQIKTLLHETDSSTVTFTKVDGTERVMNCTLNPDKIPALLTEEGSSPKKPHAENANVLAVYDLDNNGWRSFRVDSVKSIG